MKVKELISFTLNIKSAYRLWAECQQQFNKESLLSDELREADLPGDAAYNIGTALVLAGEFGINLHKGLTFGDCRAVLPRKNWRYDNGDPDGIFVYGQFLRKTYSEVTEIQALDTDVCYAIARCALLARRAGVI